MLGRLYGTGPVHGYTTNKAGAFSLTGLCAARSVAAAGGRGVRSRCPAKPEGISRVCVLTAAFRGRAGRGVVWIVLCAAQASRVSTANRCHSVSLFCAQAVPAAAMQHWCCVLVQYTQAAQRAQESSWARQSVSKDRPAAAALCLGGRTGLPRGERDAYFSNALQTQAVPVG